MPDISDILDDEILEAPIKDSKFLWLKIRTWERICLATMMLVGGLVLERASTISNRLDTIESKMGSDQKQWEVISEIRKNTNENKITITHTSGHHAVIDRDIDSMWLALKSVDTETAKVAIQSGVNKELLRLIFEDNILDGGCDKCRDQKFGDVPEPLPSPQPAPSPLPIPFQALQPIISPPPPQAQAPNAQQRIDTLNEFNHRIEQIPEKIDNYKMRQMKR